MARKGREQLEEVAQRLGLRLGDPSQFLFDEHGFWASPLPFIAKLRADEDSSGIGFAAERVMWDLMGGEWRGHHVIACRCGTSSTSVPEGVSDACAIVPIRTDLPPLSVSRAGRFRKLRGAGSDLGLGDLDRELHVEGNADLAREIVDREIAERLIRDWEDVKLEIGGQFALAHRTVLARRPTKDLARYAESLLDAAVTLRERIPDNVNDRYKAGAPEEPW